MPTAVGCWECCGLIHVQSTQCKGGGGKPCPCDAPSRCCRVLCTQGSRENVPRAMRSSQTSAWIRHGTYSCHTSVPTEQVARRSEENSRDTPRGTGFALTLKGKAELDQAILGPGLLLDLSILSHQARKAGRSQPVSPPNPDVSFASTGI